MKKIFSSILLATIVFPALAQLPGYRYQLVPYEIKRCPGEIKMPIDTVQTDEKYVYIVLYDNHTWEYIEQGRPVIDSTSVYDDFFDIEALHSHYPDSSIPAEVELCLADETHGFCVPRKDQVTSGFKFRRRRPHTGVDIALDRGDPVYAAFDGVVRFASGYKTGGYGNLVIIRHSNGLETYYGHLSRMNVTAGEPVRAGDLIGLGGTTGRSTGPHLHFETRYKGRAFDPERIFDFKKGTLRDSTFTLKKDYFSIYSHYGQTDAQSKAASQAQYYIVRKGDTLGRIASKHGTTVAKICKMNGISAKKPIRVGQRLRVR